MRNGKLQCELAGRKFGCVKTKKLFSCRRYSLSAGILKDGVRVMYMEQFPALAPWI